MIAGAEVVERPFATYSEYSISTNVNLTLPSGLAKIGDTQCTVRTIAMCTTIADLNDIPIKYTNVPTVFLKDVDRACSPRRITSASVMRPW